MQENIIDEARLNPEWLTLNVIRDIIRVAGRRDTFKSTYNNALDFGAAICPEILGEDVSILRQNRENDSTKEYRQKAHYKSIKENKKITALSLVQADIEEYESLLEMAKGRNDKIGTDKLLRKLTNFYASEEELNPDKNSENQLIFRDAYKIDRGIPMLIEGQNNRTFQLPDDNLLTIRVLHPEKAEHITGADLLYERYDKETDTVVIALVQYKIWENKEMYFSDERMIGQIQKMRDFLCNKNICNDYNVDKYRFPCCSAFLRPTDKLQSSKQKLISTGEHLPICHIDKCISITKNGAKILKYKDIKKVSLSHEMFDELFNQGKIGSKPLSLQELADLYKDKSIISRKDTMLLYAQEYPK